MTTARRSPLLFALLGALTLVLLITGIAAMERGHSAPTSLPPRATSGGTPSPPSVPAVGPSGATCPASSALLRDQGQVTQALAAAQPGAVLVLAPGTYVGNFVMRRSGTEQAPITLCGPRDAVIDGGPTTAGYAVHLDGASWWRLVGFTVQGAQKGIVTDHATHDTLAGLDVHGTGEEAVHLRSLSTDNLVEGLTVRDTGSEKAKFGEGIYIGSANKNWCKYSACGPDASDRNVIRGNDVSRTTAENIDIKEGTTGGTVVDNRLSGTGMDPSAATAWVNVKGNNWTITGNRGQDSPKDGYQVHEVYPGWGMSNVFRANQATVNGPGYGIYVQRHSLGTVVACDNRVTNAGSGDYNVNCS